MSDSFSTLLAQAPPVSVLDRISPHDVLPLVAVVTMFGAVTVIALTTILVGNWRKVRDRKIVATLIQEMLDRNMSAGEIQAILSAWQSGSGARVDLPDLRDIPPVVSRPAKPVKVS